MSYLLILLVIVDVYYYHIYQITCNHWSIIIFIGYFHLSLTVQLSSYYYYYYYY
jgi:hypothetical protein